MSKHKAGFVNIIGNPNVGKSTLMNAFVGERLSIITSKAQTTRHRILGIVNGDDFQILFSDTPGIIKPVYELQSSMMDFVKSAFEDADISSQEEVEEKIKYWQEKVPNAIIYAISALENFNVTTVFEKIVELLPESPAFYPKDQLTDKPERFFVNEAIREKILMHYKKEIPYSVEIETEEFNEEEKIIKIRSIIMVERDSQKGIIIGHKGSALRRVGTEARKDLEKFFGKKIFLELYVKVNKDWRNNKNQLRRFGYKE
jgi:GTP-binding protein Era